MCHFRVGDIVRLRGFRGKQRVTHVDPERNVISTRYLKSDNGNYDRRASDFILAPPPKPIKPRTTAPLLELMK